MNQISVSPLIAQLRNWSHSMGMKLLVVSFLVLLMGIPAIFVSGIVDERTTRAKQVMEEVGGRMGGPQTFLGPVLAIPYSTPPAYKSALPSSGFYVVFPAQADAAVKIRTEERRRSLFKVPVYQAELKFEAAFDLTGAPSAAPADATLDWSRAEMVIAVSNARGALSEGAITVNGKNLALLPVDDILDANDSRMLLTCLGAKVSDIARPDATFRVSASLSFSGAQRIAVLPYGKTTHLTVEGDWPNPSFDGGFLPAQHTASAQGFRGEWLVPFIARGVRAEGVHTILSGLYGADLGVSLVGVADPYQSVNRAVKYLLLFVGLVFLSYFVFEVTARKRVHPAQYVLVGVAQMIFYLLLLSLAERVGFDWSFLMAGAATVILLAANTHWIFHSRAQALRALLLFSLLYCFIYLLLRLEDNALLVGAVASFLAVAAVMYFTRNLNWYGSMSAGVEGPDSGGA